MTPEEIAERLVGLSLADCLAHFADRTEPGQELLKIATEEYEDEGRIELHHNAVRSGTEETDAHEYLLAWVCVYKPGREDEQSG